MKNQRITTISALSFIEFLIILAVLAILAAMILPTLSKAKTRGGAFSPRIDLPESAMATADEFNTEAYARIRDNPFLAADQNPLSTFSIDVDTAAYSNLRRFIKDRRLPPKDAVRIEEMLNYFDYDYEPPTGADPFAAHVEVMDCPWMPDHWLVRIGVKGREVIPSARPPMNLVFLIDVSGSMSAENKLPLLKESLKLLLDELRFDDQVAIVVYAGSSGLALPSTPCLEKRRILRAINKLEAGGSTHGEQGLQLAYRTASRHFIQKGINRVILCTDGDFNVGITSPGDLTRVIEEKAKSGVFLSVLGFGMGNYKDSTLEALAQWGNGNYAYIDTLNEAQKALVQQMNGTLVTIAKDVKIQVEFNPAKVAAYRLIGYENRLLNKEEFNDDRKDAGEIGAGHTVTAMYEVVPFGKPIALGKVDPLKYTQAAPPMAMKYSIELLTLKLRYKQPDGDTSQLIEIPVADSSAPFDAASPDFRFAAAVAGFGMILRDSEHKGFVTVDSVLEMADAGLGSDPFGYRNEFIRLVEQTKEILQIPAEQWSLRGEREFGKRGRQK